LTRNRGGAVAFAATLPVLWLLSRHKWRNLAVGLPVLVIALVVLRFTPMWDRFEGIWAGGDDATTVQQRFDTWRGGLRMAADHAVFGVGPGNGHRHVHAYYDNAEPGFVAHNNLLHVAGETGFVGAALYVALFVAAFVVLVRAARRHGHEPPGVAARMLIAALVAYHVAGLFISRHDLVLAYVLVGWAAAVGAKTTKRQSNKATNLGSRRVA
jgi:O-antigen ligase